MDVSKIYTHQLDNGFVLAAERMQAVSSAAFTFLLPAGAKHDPTDGLGSASVLLDWVFRGAGDRDSRELDGFLDGLGLHREGTVTSQCTYMGGALLGENLLHALAAYADVIRRPQLPPEQFEMSRLLILQHLASQDDEPRAKLMAELGKHHLPEPLGRNPLGQKDQLAKLDATAVKNCHPRVYLPAATILAVAGNFDWHKLRDCVESLFADWSGPPPAEPELGSAGPKIDHIQQTTAQTQIGIAYNSVSPTHEAYYPARLAVAVLSGGMSGRLFTEVREKRGLCYHVSARHVAHKDRGTVLCYAGTAADRAPQTLEVILDQLKRLGDGISDAELDRAKIGLKANLIMQGESTFSRASSAASDYYYLQRVRTLDEISDAIDAVTVSDVLSHLQNFPPGEFTILTLGSERLEVSC